MLSEKLIKRLGELAEGTIPEPRVFTYQAHVVTGNPGAKRYRRAMVKRKAWKRAKRLGHV